MRHAKLLILPMLMTMGTAQATDQVSGTETVYTSPNRVQERCVVLSPMPGAHYPEEQQAQASALCKLDFYDTNVALCPKLVSTSPGTFIYELSDGPYQQKQAAFEQEVCPQGHIVTSKADGPPASFKVTMNGKHTSGSFSQSSLLYYHMSRYLDAGIHVPVAVWRSMDRKAHAQRVTHKGLQHSAEKSSLKMNHAAWQVLDRAEQDPESYAETSELFTADRSQIYGVMLHIKGKRYHAEVNSSRRSGWGEGQNRDFQKTAPFQALRSDKPLAEAIQEGRAKATKDPTLKKAMSKGFSDEQIAYWMQDLTEITLLDYIFRQQDRIGNIDYVNYWHWIENDQVMYSEHKPNESDATRLRRTWLNDNDAGVKRLYANFTKRTQMLEKIRHYNPKTYTRLMSLDKDLKEQGPLFLHLKNTFGLTTAQFNRTVQAIHDAAAIIRSTCEAGKLRFDLDPDTFFRTGNSSEQKIACGETHEF
ncbi:hypothetical protein [Pseudomaricurvus sp.]|uniref:hypothetical protein n=1 Tax=Pseudomaricurvus sp. TaxID=2004510 RepID=UPI003F6C913E